MHKAAASVEAPAPHPKEMSKIAEKWKGKEGNTKVIPLFPQKK